MADYQVVVAPDGKKYAVPRAQQKAKGGKGCLSNILCFLFLAALGGGIYYAYAYTDLFDRLTDLLGGGEFVDNSPTGVVGEEIRGNNGTNFIGIVFTTNTTELDQQPYIDAAQYWSDVLKDQTVTSPQTMNTLTFTQTFGGPTNDLAVICSQFSSPNIGSFIFNNPTMDHMIIAIEIQDFSSSGLLGRAGPCLDHQSGGQDFSIFGAAQFSSTIKTNAVSEAAYYNTAYETARHEFGHILGIGTKWSSAGVIADKVYPSGAPPANLGNTPKYTGALGLEGYKDLDATVEADSATFVPVEDGRSGKSPGSAFIPGIDPSQGKGIGSIDSHFKEAYFKDELMTYLKTGDPYASNLTLKSLLDIGWESVDTSLAEAATLACCALRGSKTEYSQPLVFIDDAVMPPERP